MFESKELYSRELSTLAFPIIYKVLKTELKLGSYPPQGADFIWQGLDSNEFK